MPTFTIEGEFWAHDIDDALDFLARYFHNVINGIYTEGGERFVEVKPKEEADD